MGAIFYREIKAYFGSLLAWSLIAAFLFIIGMFMLLGVSAYADMSASAMQGGMPCNVNTYFLPPMIQSIGVMMMFFLPLLTMRSFSEDKRSGTLDLLFTYPISEWQIVWGKFLAALVVVCIMLALSSLTFLYLGVNCTIEWPVLLCGYLALILVACAMVSMGIFTSSVTNSQLTASAFNYGLLLCLWFLAIPDKSASYTESFGQLSIFGHIENLAKGVLNSQDIIYYVALTAFFLFLTVRFLESRKWKG
ncbi:MAG: ABC transporter permease subunit [Candidatus Bruticola sp.]